MRYCSYAKFPKSGVESLGLKRYANSHDVHSSNKYDLMIEHTSFVAKSWYHIERIYPYADIDNVYHKSFNISSEAAIKVLDRITHLANHCDSGYQYQSLSNNCLDFTQHIYSLAGLQGDHFVEMHPNGYPLNVLGAYKAYTDLKNWADEIYTNVWQNIDYHPWD
jgi:hypothetical protein